MVIRTAGTQKQSTTMEVTNGKKNPILHGDIEYDFTQPEQTIRDFVAAVKAMVARFEYNKGRIVAIEAELQDLYHYIELSSFKTVPNGYKLYRKLAELRRERRSCKNENDLLQPIYEYFHATEVLTKLAHVQGECAKVKSVIDNRSYLVRTDILDEWLELPEKKEEEQLYCLDIDPVKKEDVTDEPDTLKPPTKHTKDRPMSDFKQVWPAAN